MGESDRLERIRRFADAGRRPDENHVERGEADEAGANRPRRRDRRYGAGRREARAGDQRDARRVLNETARQPGRKPQPRRYRRPQPPTRTTAEEPSGGGEHRSAEGRDQRERVRTLRDEVYDRDAGSEQRRRHGDPDPASTADARLARGRRGRRRLHGA